MAHLLVEISGHGYGHLAQVAPVLHALAARRDDLAISVRTPLPESVAAPRLPQGTRFVRPPYEPVPAMADPLSLDKTATARRFRHYHAGYPHHIATEASGIADLEPDLVLTDVGYTIIDAALRLGVPAVGLCSFTWADVFATALGETPTEIDQNMLADMRAAYNRCHSFITPEPRAAMPWLTVSQAVGPIAAPATNRRDSLLSVFGQPVARLGVAATGGFAYGQPPALPARDGLGWLVADADAATAARADVVALEGLGYPVGDLIASADVLVTKPGYGSFVEAAAAGTPVIYPPRPDWPEWPALDAWAQEQGNAWPIAADRLADPTALGETLDQALAAPRPAPVATPGADAAAAILGSYLDG